MFQLCGKRQLPGNIEPMNSNGFQTGHETNIISAWHQF